MILDYVERFEWGEKEKERKEMRKITHKSTT